MVRKRDIALVGIFLAFSVSLGIIPLFLSQPYSISILDLEAAPSPKSGIMLLKIQNLGRDVTNLNISISVLFDWGEIGTGSSLIDLGSLEVRTIEIKVINIHRWSSRVSIINATITLSCSGYSKTFTFQK